MTTISTPFSTVAPDAPRRTSARGNDRRQRPTAPAAKTWIAVLGATLGAFMAVLNIQIVNASLADIQGAIGAGIDDGGWISTSYLIAEIVVIPLTGWLAAGVLGPHLPADQRDRCSWCSRRPARFAQDLPSDDRAARACRALPAAC